MTSRLLIGLTTAVLLLSACGDGTDAETFDTADDAQEQTTCPDAPEPVEPPVDVPGDLQAKPEFQVPEGDPPAELQVADIVVGSGDLACSGDTVAMQYVGVTYADGKQFDASWDRGGEPFEFQLGGGSVIGGWDQGIVGMRQGGRRMLVIPPDLGYGQQGAPPDIPPGATLVFVVDMVGVTG